MSVLKYLLPALAGVQFASAQCSVGATTTITSTAQATALANSCRTFTGTIAISPRLNEDVAFDGLEQIKDGGLYAANGAVTGLSSTTLSSIDGVFYLQNDTALTTINFPSLTSVNNIHWVSLANLYGWTLTSGIQTANGVLVSDTQVTTLTGLNLKTVDNLSINNNVLLQNISMQLQNATGQISISQNGGMPTVSFPDLTAAGTILYRGVSDIDLSSLKTVSQLLGIYESSLQALDLPKVTETGGLAIIDSSSLTNFSAPKLALLDGSITISDATGLKSAIAFPAVTQVRGAVRIAGDFTSVSMPMVTYINGAFFLRSTKNIDSTCNHFNNVRARVIQGKYGCVGKVATPTIGASSTPTMGSGSSTSTGAAPRMQQGSTPMVGGVLGVFLAVLGML